MNNLPAPIHVLFCLLGQRKHLALTRQPESLIRLLRAVLQHLTQKRRQYKIRADQIRVQPLAIRMRMTTRLQLTHLLVLMKCLRQTIKIGIAHVYIAFDLRAELMVRA